MRLDQTRRMETAFYWETLRILRNMNFKAGMVRWCLHWCPRVLVEDDDITVVLILQAMTHCHKNLQRIMILLIMLLRAQQVTLCSTHHITSSSTASWRGSNRNHRCTTGTTHIDTQSNALLAVGAEFQQQQGKVILVTIKLLLSILW